MSSSSDLNGFNLFRYFDEVAQCGKFRANLQIALLAGLKPEYKKSNGKPVFTSQNDVVNQCMKIINSCLLENEDELIQKRILILSERLGKRSSRENKERDVRLAEKRKSFFKNGRGKLSQSDFDLSQGFIRSWSKKQGKGPTRFV